MRGDGRGRYCQHEGLASLAVECYFASNSSPYWVANPATVYVLDSAIPFLNPHLPGFTEICIGWLCKINVNRIPLYLLFIRMQQLTFFAENISHPHKNTLEFK